MGEFIATAVQERLGQIGVKTLHIAQGLPRENDYNDGLNGSLRDELLNGEIFYSLAKAKVLIEAWRRHYTIVRLHSRLGSRSPTPRATPPLPVSGSASLLLQPAPGSRDNNAPLINPDHPRGRSSLAHGTVSDVAQRDGPWGTVLVLPHQNFELMRVRS